MTVNGFKSRVAPAGAAFQPNMTSNPAWRRGLQSWRPVRRVAELGSVGVSARPEESLPKPLLTDTVRA